MATYRELKEQAQKLLDQAEAQRKQEVKEALASIEKTMSQFDISVEELFDHLKAAGFRARSGRAGSKGAAKARAPKAEARYRNPATGDTWSGRGRPPAWIREAEEKGKSRDKFLIK
jgi:DNA-binding protein H-NS